MTSKKAESNAILGGIWAVSVVWWFDYEYPMALSEVGPLLMLGIAVGLVTYSLLLAIWHRDESS
jgi:hypothetical protein